MPLSISVGNNKILAYMIYFEDFCSMAFSTEIIAWYTQHKRDLPWRNTSDPYIIWLSEIILQQTRVDQGMPYFHRFVAHYPTIAHFAEAPEAAILRLWQGLGYYSRARNMHKAAQEVMDRHNGLFPTAYTDLLALKGVGEYTAAAISSFSANEARAVVDGNVFRLLARFFGISTPINSGEGKKTFSQLANELLDAQQPGLHNQAMMEFGALQCVPKNPDCGICPLQLECYANNNGKVAALPQKNKKGKSRDRHFNYFVVTDGDRVLMKKRGPKDIWENLYELPLLETENALGALQLIERPEFEQLFGKNVLIEEIYRPKKHVLSHQNIYAAFYKLTDAQVVLEKNSSMDYVIKKELDTLAKPKLIFAFLKQYFTA